MADARPLARRERSFGQNPCQKYGQPPRGKAEFQKGRKTSRRRRVKTAVCMGMGAGERKQRELDSAGGVCARASVATVNARP
eukprot:5780064-Pleurochrysis_carterae.AAC.6